MASSLKTLNTEPFPGVIGQSEPRRLMMRAILSSRLAHAYLFLGPEGTGKRALAIEMARVLNCLKGIDSSLNGCQCHSCISMMKWQHQNLHTIFPLPKLEKEKKNPFEESDKAHAEIRIKLAASPYAPLLFAKTGRILIDHVRNAIDIVSFTPDEFGIRVLIIHPADAMNEQASNALLKLLEEPPEKCLLILTAENRRDLLPTILSRCQQVKFSPLPRELIAEALSVRNNVEGVRAATIAALANGSYTHAIELIDNQTEVMTTDSLEFLRAVATGNVAKIAESIDKWLGGDATRGIVKDRLDLTGLWILDALTVLDNNLDGDGPGLRIPNSATSVTKMAQRFGPERLLDALKEVEEAKLAIDANAIQSMALTVLAIKLKRIFLS